MKLIYCLQMQNDNDIVKYDALHLIRFILANKLPQLHHGAFHLMPRFCKVAWSWLSTASTNGLCTGGSFIVAVVEYSSCPADWTYPSALFSSSKQKHEVEHNQTSIAKIRRLVEFTLVMTDVQVTTANIARYHKIWAE